MSGYIRTRNLTDEVGPGARMTIAAGATVYADRFVKYSGATAVLAGDGDVAVIGVSAGKLDNGEASGQALITEDILVVKSGLIGVTPDVYINAGEAVKAGYHGKAVPALTSSKAGATRKAVVGGAFTNQPANDGIEVVSSSAADTMQLTIYGTTNGGVVVVAETVTLNGTTPVATVKVDWGVCLGFEIPAGQPTAAGTITVREASGDATISTMTTGVRQKGVSDVTAANQRAFNHAVTAVADSGTTKTVGYVGTDTTGTAIKEALVLTGATKVRFTNKLQKITKLLVGDLEVARTVTFKTGTLLDVGPVILGTALTSVTTTDVTNAVAVDVDLACVPAGIGKIAVATEASDVISNTVAETTFSNGSRQIAANLLEKGKIMRIRGQGIATATNSTDTLAIKVKIGSTAILTIPATDVADNDIFQWQFDVIPRADAGATAACVGFGTYGLFGAAGTATQRSAILASTNFATNGALVVSVTGTWSVASASNSCRLDNFEIEFI